MPSFFEKLKKGMGVEELTESSTEEVTEEKKVKSPRKTKTKKIPKEDEIPIKKLGIKTVNMEREEEKPETKTEEKEITKISLTETPVSKEKWFEPEGQLAIDVYQTDGELVIQSAIAGVKSEELDISIEGDVVTIKGIREKLEESEEKKYFYQECYWGSFSREIILPEEADPSRAEGEMKNGILTIRIPKIERKRKRKIIIKG